MKYILILLLIGCTKPKDGYCKYDTDFKYQHNDWSIGPVYPDVKVDTAQIHNLTIKKK